MKKLKLIIIVILCAFLAGCREYGEKRIVKLITIDSDNIAIYSYDYSRDKPSYIKEEKKNNGIENTIVELLAENVYDLKLCKYAVCDKEVIKNQIEDIYNALTDSKFSPDIVIVEGNTSEESINYTEINKSNYPIYTYKMDEGITGVVENADDNSKNVIINSRFYTSLDKELSFIFDILNNNVNREVYVFENDDNMYSAVLERTTAYYYVDNNVMNIGISTVLKSYKGMASNEKSREKFVNILKNSIEKNILHILNDEQLSEEFDLLWYGNIEKFNDIDINITVI